MTPVRTYRRGRKLVSMKDHVADKTYVYHFDHQGTTQCLTDAATGAVTDRFATDAWGVQVKRTGNSINRHWYVGNSGYYREQINSYYVRHRAFNANLGRWMTRDPEDIDADFPYTFNAPVASIDPNGLLRIGNSCARFTVQIKGIIDCLCNSIIKQPTRYLRTESCCTIKLEPADYSSFLNHCPFPEKPRPKKDCCDRRLGSLLYDSWCVHENRRRRRNTQLYR